MKKMLSIILAIVMVYSLSVTALAEEVTVTDPASESNETFTDGSYTKNNITIGATYTEGETTAPDKVYSVNITWSVPTITYTATADTYKWDPNSLKYQKTEGTGGTWSTNNTTTVTVTNKSDAAVNASVKYTDSTEDDITSSATWMIDNTTYTEGGNQNIGSAAVSNNTDIQYTNTDTTGTAQSCTFTGTISVTAGSIIQNTNNIGTISITLSKAQ